jgi:hypothetical protein
MSRVNECGHPEKKHYNKGMCAACFCRKKREDPEEREKHNAQVRAYLATPEGREKSNARRATAEGREKHNAIERARYAKKKHVFTPITVQFDENGNLV